MAKDTDKTKDGRASPLKENFNGGGLTTPDETMWSVVQAAYLSSRTTVASSPLVFLDKAVSGLRDLAVRKAREAVSPEVDASLVSTVRDTWVAAFKLVDAFRGASGDNKITPVLENRIEGYFAGRSRPIQHGDYDIYMAAGWKPAGPIKINGKMVDDPSEITNMLAVFVRDKKGDMEILDPSQKMTSFSETGRLFSALWDSPKNNIDKRWQETAGTFIKWQFAPMVPAMVMGGISAMTKIPVVSSKASGVITAMEKVASSGLVVKGSAGAGVVGVLSNAGDVYDLVGGGISGALSNIELHQLAANLTKVVTSQKPMSKHELMERLNDVLGEYSNDVGTNTKQIYVPSLKSPDQAWGRLKILLRGDVDGFKKDNTPWDKWTRAEGGLVSLGNVQEAIRQNAEFRIASLRVCEKALKGQALSDQEYFVLRLQLNAGQQGAGSMRPMALFGGVSGDGIKYTAEERAETLNALKSSLSSRLKHYAEENPEKASKDYGIKQQEPKEFSLMDALKEESYSDQSLLKFVKSELSSVEGDRRKSRQASMVISGGPFAGLVAPD